MRRRGFGSKRLAGAAFVITLLIGAPLLAQGPGGGGGMSPDEQMAQEKQQQAIESQARQTVEALFDRLCPGRCELVDLSARMQAPENVGSVEPGFGAGGQGSFEVEPEALEMTVLLDSKLPSTFQQNIPRMIEYQLDDLAPEIEVRRESLDFPEPQNRPSPPEESSGERERRPSPPRRPPPPAPRPEPEEEEPDEEADEEAVADEQTESDEEPPGVWERFVEDVAPWIGPMLMMLLLFLLAMPLLRRFAELTDRGRREPGGAGRPAGGGESETDVEALRADLTESRAVKNRVLRRWIQEDPEAVADLVRLLGPGIVADLKSDESLKAELEEVSELVAGRRDPLSDEEIERICHEARARLSSARLTYDEQALDADWEFLEGVSVATLQRIVRSCDSRETVHVVGQLPATLRSSYLESLEADERKELFMAAGTGELDKRESRELAARLRKAADEYGHLGAEAEGQAALVVDMLESLSVEEQHETLRDLEQTRPEVAEAVMARVCLASAALHVPDAVVAEAIHRMPVDELSAVLREAGEALQQRVLEVAPGQKAEDLRTELALEAPVAKSEYLEARSRLTDELRGAMRREGEDLVEANRRAIRGGAEATSTSEARR